MSQFLLQPGATVVFQGDSITDSGRDYHVDTQLGFGYPNFVSAWLSARYPEHHLTFLNRGINGNRIYALEERWSADCIDLQPDWLSILIGINDTWRVFDSGMSSPIDEFEACYRRLLDRVKAETSARIIIMEPYVLHTPPDRLTWRDDLNPRIEAVRRVARDYDTLYLPLDSMFAAVATRREPEYWAGDGVHPSFAGHALIAQAWIDMVTG